MLIHNIGKVDPNNIKKNETTYLKGLKQIIETNKIEFIDRKFVKMTENNEIWITAYTRFDNIETKNQTYYNFSFPETEFDYIKQLFYNIKNQSNVKLTYMVSLFK